MSADLIRWEPNGAGMLAGYVGTVGACLLEIFEPGARDKEWILQSFLHGQAGRLSYGTGPDELKARAEELLREFASSLGAVFPEPVSLLRFDGTRCDFDVLNDEEEVVQCPEPSRYLVLRSDHDPSYDVAADRAPTEACEAHLADTVAGLMDGDDKITATVQIRWS